MPTSTSSNQSFKNLLTRLEDFLNEYLVTKAPVLPKGFKDFLVQSGPIILLIFIILGGILLLISIPVLLFATAVTASFSVASSGLYGGGLLASLLFLVISLGVYILEAMSISGLMKRSKSKGWNFLFYAQLLSGLSAILSLNLFNVLFAILWLYVIFQIREFYSN